MDRRWRRFVGRISPDTKRWLQRVYSLLSGAILLSLLAYVEEVSGADWTKFIAVSAAYLAVFGLCIFWIVPRQIVRNIMVRTTALTKIGMIFNYLSFLLFMQICFLTWEKRALILAGLFVATWAGGYVLTHFIWPVSANVQMMYATHDKIHFDPSAPQGRNARFDNN